MKKLLGLVLGFVLLLTITAPAYASECRVRRVERRGYVRLRVVCVNPTEPVNINETVTSDDGSATSTVRVSIWSSGSVFSSIRTWAYASGSSN